MPGTARSSPQRAPPDQRRKPPITRFAPHAKPRGPRARRDRLRAPILEEKS
ncbi:hypothetical protein BSIN_4398 [Burkholderia singularis]|uniref:Uncharacterized protein n=1 Tax=Burkholderia singularis TaxID=1503053 RepID=A0A238H8C0_9BURK|nr:hypothetical protein BSIN_4398 [Burkholderia singularis]